jgi:hypothetical protein
MRLAPGFAIPAVTAAAAAVVIARRRRSGQGASAERRFVVTIDRPRDEVAAGAASGPLAALGDSVDVRTKEAPGGRGTELSARPLSAPPATAVGSLARRATGADPRQDVRRALRETKQLLEVGEIMRQEPQPEGHRRSTPPGRLMDLVAHRSGGEGVL